MQTKPGKLFIISAPSGGGKTTLAHEVRRRMAGTELAVERVVTTTTRPSRPNERDGVDYHFLSDAEFAKQKEAGGFLETTTYHDYSYGSPASIVDQMKTGRSFLMATDRPGAKEIAGKVAGVVTIWLTVPSVDVLRPRLERRGAQSVEQIEGRLELARKEMAEEAEEKLFQFTVVNDDFDTAVEEVMTIIKLEFVSSCKAESRSS